MVIGKDKVVSLHYTLTGSDGEVIDRSEESEPFDYLHGAENIVPGLERALEGRGPGDELRVAVAAEDGYGERDEEMLLVVQRERVEAAGPPEIGMRFQADTPAGARVFTITGIEGDEVTIDGNHPLAGETLNFDVKVVGVRDATAEELEHGHPHGPDGHHHHG
jgi:FKBP-type peptidyl-prolyl cis-trans isomerase SlyD